MRTKYYERNGYAGKEIERVRSQGKQIWQKLCKRDFDIQKQEGRGEIRNSRYHGMYLKIIREVEPQYFTKNKKKRVIMAQFGCGNEERDT